MATPPQLNKLSRYKDTYYFDDTVDGEDQFVFGLMEPPGEFTREDVVYKRHRVKQAEIGFLDLIAVRYYGPGNEQMWWSIALVNGIIDPELEMFMGQVLLIPPRDIAARFKTRRGAYTLGG